MRYLLIVLTLLLVFPASALATKPAPEHKVTICHALPASASHAYNRITVDIASSGYVKGGHHRPGGDIGDKHANGGDIIPPYTYGEFSYPGQNWTAQGRAIWENGCKVPPPPPRDRLATTFSAKVCADPRLLITVRNNGTTPVTYQFFYRSAKTNRIESFGTTVRPGVRNILFPRWVKGKTYLRYTISARGFVFTAQTRGFWLPATTPWGKMAPTYIVRNGGEPRVVSKRCPANLKAAIRLARNY